MKKIVSIVVIMLILLCMTTVYAANDSFKTTLKTSPAQAKGEDTVIITIGLKDIAIESGDKGIGAYTANVKFDSSVFEYVSTNGTDEWEAPLYQDGLITSNTKTAEVVNTTGDIATITLKVKKDAKVGETVIELTNFSGSTGRTDVETEDTSIKMTIAENNNGNNSGNNGGNNNGNNGTTNNGNNNNPTTGNNTSNNNNLGNIPGTSNNTGTITNETIKEGKLPKTGSTDFIIFTIIGAVSILAIIFFIRMLILNKDIK